jgi:hypothetical protein
MCGAGRVNIAPRGLVQKYTRMKYIYIYIYIYIHKKNCNNTEAVQNKSNLQIKIILQNTQTFRVFTIAIKREIVYRRY